MVAFTISINPSCTYPTPEIFHAYWFHKMKYSTVSVFSWWVEESRRDDKKMKALIIKLLRKKLVLYSDLSFLWDESVFPCYDSLYSSQLYCTTILPSNSYHARMRSPWDC